MSTATAAAAQSGEAPAAAAGAVRVKRASAWWILIAGVIGFLSSADLLIEKIEMLRTRGMCPPAASTRSWPVAR